MKLAINQQLFHQIGNEYWIDDEYCLKRYKSKVCILPHCEACGFGTLEPEPIKDEYVCKLKEIEINSQMDLDLFVMRKYRESFKSYLTKHINI